MDEPKSTNTSQLNYVHVVGTLEDDPKLGETGRGYQFVYFVVKNRRVWTGKDGEEHEVVENIPIWIWKSALIPLRIPEHRGHPIRTKATTESGAIRPPIPEQSGHLIRSNPATLYCL